MELATLFAHPSMLAGDGHPDRSLFIIGVLVVFYLTGAAPAGRAAEHPAGGDFAPLFVRIICCLTRTHRLALI
jgi:hypothetical protein